MKKIRIGKDIYIKWTILTNSEVVPLKGRNLKLLLTTPNNKKEILDFEIVDNIIVTKYLGIQQKLLGKYNLTLWENYNQEGQTAVDYCQVFELVQYTCMENTDADNLTFVPVNLNTSKIETIPKFGVFSTKVKYIEVVNKEIENPDDNTLYIII